MAGEESGEDGERRGEPGEAGANNSLEEGRIAAGGERQSEWKKRHNWTDMRHERQETDKER